MNVITKMRVFGESNGIRLLIRAEDQLQGHTAEIDLVMDVLNTENLIAMLKGGLSVHKGIRLLSCGVEGKA